ncbi:protein of unknown function [Dyadobacter soli]|uniref:Uncharacterized protein n=1 Tax=Dyadobacter soli TaxID=659014 RepID=A0A1G7LL83_9BACT|nr:monodechloroaminopyrrolnitrin synthase PrnB family protein [Dyadobacter soli]SDF50114.1 protein of unknown function [Dyadobacter soli]
MTAVAYGIWKGQEKSSENDIIANLDPLGADDLMKRIPDINNSRDVSALVSLANTVTPSLCGAQDLEYHQANAAIRDIGIFLGSIKRHGIEPCAVIHDLEAIMNVLAETTSMPPRDTLLHYTVWNPADHRRRTYTDTRDEHCLIDSVVKAMDPLVKAIRLLANLHHTPMQFTDFKIICENAAARFQQVVDGMVLARRNVSLSFFATELRLYFDPVRIGGREYLGPGAVEMPMFVFDQLLWSCDCADEDYRVFKETYLPYVHPEMRDIYLKYQKHDSLLGKCFRTIIDDRLDFDPIVLESMRALRQCFQQLKRFRMPHKKVAEEAYAQEIREVDSENSDHRSHGSGGYSPDILSHIVKLTNQKVAKLDAYISFYEVKSGASLVYSGR